MQGVIMGSEMKIEIPTKLIEDSIRCEMVRQIGEGAMRDKFVEAVVKNAMESKKDSYSNTPTYFQQAVNEMIKDEALKIFKSWLDENRAAISTALYNHLNGNKQARLKEFADQLAGNISKYGITVNLDLDRKD
jgi:hypothetical protein